MVNPRQKRQVEYSFQPIVRLVDESNSQEEKGPRFELGILLIAHP
jgi:hypothetical protein